MSRVVREAKEAKEVPLMACLACDAVKLDTFEVVESLDRRPHAVVPHERVVVCSQEEMNMPRTAE